MNNQVRFLLLPVLFSLFIVTGILLIGNHPYQASLAATAACTPGPHSGTITADQNWCLGDNPHLVEGTVTVAPGVTLTIEPGVVVQAPGYPYDIGIIVQGSFVSVGNSAQPITLTSTTGVPTWAGLIVNGGHATLAYTTVEYACSDARKANVAVINGGQLEMTDSRLPGLRAGHGDLLGGIERAGTG